MSTWLLENLEKTQIWKDLVIATSLTDKYLEKIIDYLNNFWPKLLWAILVIWIWFKIIKILNKVINKSLEKINLDPMIKTFSLSFISIILKISVFLAAAWILWVQTTSFIAMFTAAWVAIWMSLSWTLQNFAGWMIILAFKPYKIWDFISIWWNDWTVKSIHIFDTIILTLDRKTIIIPNSQISNGAMTNFSTEPIRRQDISIWIWYNSDIDKVKELFLKILEDDERIVKDEDYKINFFIADFQDSSILVTLRYFINTTDLFSVKCDLMEKILKTCNENNIIIPFPQMEVSILKN